MEVLPNRPTLPTELWTSDPPASLFPFIYRVTFVVSQQRSLLDMWIPVLGPKVSSICICLPSPDGLERPSLAIHFFHAIASRCPRLEELDVDGDAFAIVPQELRLAVHGGSKLRRMRLSGFRSVPRDLLAALASLPSLEALDIPHTTGDTLVLQCQGFPTLKSLTYRGIQEDMDRLLKLIPPLTLTSLSPLIALGSSIDQSIGTLCSRFPHLNSLNLQIVTGPELGFHDIKDLALCTELQALTIETFQRGVALTASDINKLTNAWPKLESLHLETTAPLPSLFALQPLATNCPKLVSLSISVDVSRVEDDDGSPIVPSTSLRMVKFLAESYAPKETGMVAHILHSMWPAAHITCEMDWMDKVQRDRWTEVVRLAERSSDMVKGSVKVSGQGIRMFPLPYVY